MAIRPLINLRPDESRVFLSALQGLGVNFGVEADFFARALSGRRLDMSPPEAALFLQGLTSVDEYQMGRAGTRRPRVRDLIRSGRLRYDREDPREEWKSYRQIIEELRRDGIARADCEDLATLWAAEARVDSWDSEAFPFVYRVNPRLSHVVVSLPGYSRKERRSVVIDPSRLAGMGVE